MSFLHHENMFLIPFNLDNKDVIRWLKKHKVEYKISRIMVNKNHPFNQFKKFSNSVVSVIIINNNNDAALFKLVWG